MKSVFWKLFIRFIAIILVSFFLLLIFSYSRIDKITKDQKRETLISQNEKIYEYIDEHKEDIFIRADENILDDLTGIIKKAAINTGAIIWVCDDDGKMIGTSEDYIDTSFFTLNNLTKQYYFTEKEGYKSFLGNKTSLLESEYFENKINTLEGKKMSFITNYEILIFDSYPPVEIELVIFMHTTMNEFNALKREILMSFIFPLIVALSFGTILVGLTAMDISKPVNDLNQVANSVRSGDYKKRAIAKERVDELGQLATNFNKMIDEIEELDKSRLSFISDMSHELRTPMTTINGFITGILDGTIPYDRQDYYLNLVKDEVNRLNRLINNLLLLSKIESEEIQLLTTDFDINMLISKTLANLENVINDKQIKMDVRFDGKTTYVNGNEDDIERVIFNLLHNAIKFSDRKSTVKIYTKVGKKAVVYVEDQGIGINEDELIRIWNRFYKADKSRSVDKTGTGLGLSIVKKIINNHNENIEVKSEIDKGTTFSFTIKLSEDL